MTTCSPTFFGWKPKDIENFLDTHRKLRQDIYALRASEDVFQEQIERQLKPITKRLDAGLFAVIRGITEAGELSTLDGPSAYRVALNLVSALPLTREAKDKFAQASVKLLGLDEGGVIKIRDVVDTLSEGGDDEVPEGVEEGARKEGVVGTVRGWITRIMDRFRGKEPEEITEEEASGVVIEEVEETPVVQIPPLQLPSPKLPTPKAPPKLPTAKRVPKPVGLKKPKVAPKAPEGVLEVKLEEIDDDLADTLNFINTTKRPVSEKEIDTRLDKIKTKATIFLAKQREDGLITREQLIEETKDILQQTDDLKEDWRKAEEKKKPAGLKKPKKSEKKPIEALAAPLNPLLVLIDNTKKLIFDTKEPISEANIDKSLNGIRALAQQFREDDIKAGLMTAEEAEDSEKGINTLIESLKKLWKSKEEAKKLRMEETGSQSQLIELKEQREELEKEMPKQPIKKGALSKAVEQQQRAELEKEIKTDIKEASKMKVPEGEVEKIMDKLRDRIREAESEFDDKRKNKPEELNDDKVKEIINDIIKLEITLLNIKIKNKLITKRGAEARKLEIAAEALDNWDFWIKSKKKATVKGKGRGRRQRASLKDKGKKEGEGVKSGYPMGLQGVSANDIIKRLHLLMGSINAGNTSKKLKEEAVDLIDHLLMTSAISKRVHKALHKQLM